MSQANNVEIISAKHIDYILSYAYDCGLHFHLQEPGRTVRKFNANITADLEVLGQILTAENQAAVNHAYRENVAAAKCTYRFYRLTSLDSEVQVLKALDCYEHYTSDLPNYQGLFAAVIINTIRAHAISQLPGYKSADWEINS